MKMNIKSLLGIIPILLCMYAQGQLSVFEANTNAEREAAVQSLVGEGIQILNVTVDCGVDGFGTYSNTGSNLGFEQGIILTSGEIALAIPGSPSITGGDGNGGDPQLSALAGFDTYDKCIVEFDLIPAGDNVDFQYVWGSYEYQSYTCSSFNDIFAFFVSGPDPLGGPDYNEVNIALVPGTNDPVAIGTVNNGSGMNGTPCIDPFTGGNCPCNSDLFVPNANQIDISYYGFTKVFNAHFDAVPCETYHLKLAVADVSDSALDSGVFLGAESLSSPGVLINAYTGFESEGFDGAVEGCMNGIIDLSFDFDVSTDILLNYTLGGAAIPGVDYILTDDLGLLNTTDQTILVPVGTTSITLHLEAINDGIAEGPELFEMTIENIASCFSIPSSTDNLEILDEFTVSTLFPEASICPGEEAILSVNVNTLGDLAFSWSPAEYVQDPTAPFTSTTNNVTEPTTFTCTVTLNGCIGTTNVQVDMKNLPGFQDETYYMCEDGTINLDRYSALPGYIIAWNPATGLDNPESPNPNFSFTNGTSQTFTVNFIAIDPNFCNDSYTVTVEGLVPGSLDIGADISECDQVSTVIGPTSQAGFTYSWSPTEGLSDPNIAQPTVTISNSGTTISRTYTLTVSDANGCTATDDIIINVLGKPDVNAGADVLVIAGSQTTLNASGAVDYVWSPATWLSATNIPNPVIIPTDDAATDYEYIVTGTDANGCVSTDTVVVSISRLSTLQLPNAFSPNGDGNNDELMIHAKDVTSIIDWKIFNRWGDLVFDAKGDIDAKWDGTKNGQIQDLGVYVYVIKYQGLMASDVKELKGNVTLLR